ncbi:MAG: hypothetical protein K5877_10480 [Lachnospiraceae bacterium]|nr:hypothetical protein [Lachnospiraceae bacterium]
MYTKEEIITAECLRDVDIRILVRLLREKPEEANIELVKSIFEHMCDMTEIIENQN